MVTGAGDIQVITVQSNMSLRLDNLINLNRLKNVENLIKTTRSDVISVQSLSADTRTVFINKLYSKQKIFGSERFIKFFLCS